MPTISLFYGIVIRMYFFDDSPHKTPHFHAYYGDDEAVFSIQDGEIITGKIPNRKVKLVQAWAEIHQEDLLADWKLAVEGQDVQKIEPLR
jgi:hypothetical protein